MRDPNFVVTLLHAPAPEIAAVPVGAAVNDVRSQGPGLVEPAAG